MRRHGSDVYILIFMAFGFSEMDGDLQRKKIHKREILNHTRMIPNVKIVPSHLSD